ncbi:GPI anchored serine-threonine rich protein [Alternaria rosae]|uniref:GPI anchored serine-threonine rich protein n=1 Tax=Alternaria rosae TaxID=1187941 RepID=UPI001E8D2E16|nr:GPI anchored serine-threonine rich protein [Alternaria rosae]KAH6882580.1 GPI anchored serine-threonine rich protein [Alternaria rosae]
MYSKVSIITFFAGLAAAQIHAPVGEPSGNPITRPLNEVVPTCEQFTITWQPTTPNTVSVLLLKGPSTNVVKFGPSIAEGISNSGSLSWTPASTLEATNGPNGYGIQIIDDVTGQYQYSTQFGISAGKCEEAVSSSMIEPSSVAAAASSTPAASYGNGYGASTPAASHTPIPLPSSVHSSEAPYPTTVMTSAMVPAYSTGVHANGTVPMPTAGGNATTSRLPEATTNAASGVQAALSFAGAAAAFAFML